MDLKKPAYEHGKTRNYLGTSYKSCDSKPNGDMDSLINKRQHTISYQYSIPIFTEVYTPIQHILTIYPLHCPRLPPPPFIKHKPAKMFAQQTESLLCDTSLYSNPPIPL